MFKLFLSAVLLFLSCFTASSFTIMERDTDLFILKNGYSFKADLIDTNCKYYVYNVYRGERLLRCVKKSEVSRITFNYITPAIVSVESRPPSYHPPEDLIPVPVIVTKNKFNPYNVTLVIRKGFEVIDTVRTLYDQDLTHYKQDENAPNAFSSPIAMGPKYSQAELDSCDYQGTKANGKRQGGGILYFSNGAIYAGKISNNTLIGYGSYSDENIDYKGMFANNMLNGLGICYYFDNGDIYKDATFKGLFKDGLFWEGALFYTTADNQRYVQQFKQGNPDTAKVFFEE